MVYRRYKQIIWYVISLIGLSSHTAFLQSSSATILSLHKPIISRIIFPDSTDYQEINTYYQDTLSAAKLLIAIKNKKWQSTLIDIFYERYKEYGVTKLSIACELSSEPLVNHYIFAYKISDLEKKTCTWTPRYKEFYAELEQEAVGTTPLLSACANGGIRTVQLLLAHGASCTQTTNEEKITPLMEAASEGNSELVRILLEKDASTLDWQDIYGGTAVHKAVSKGHLETTNILLNAGAKPDIEATNILLESTYNALHTAISNLEPALVKTLIDHGSDVNTLGWCMTPLGIALQNFAENGVEAYVKEHQDDTESEKHYQERATSIVMLVLNHADLEPNKPSLHGSRALHSAVRYGLVDIVKELIKKGANPDQQDAYGTTPRHIAENCGINWDTN